MGCWAGGLPNVARRFGGLLWGLGGLFIDMTFHFSYTKSDETLGKVVLHHFWGSCRMRRAPSPAVLKLPGNPATPKGPCEV